MAKAKRGEGPNKMALVRDAMEALGADAKPKAIADHVKNASGVDIPTAMIRLGPLESQAETGSYACSAVPLAARTSFPRRRIRPRSRVPF